MVNDVGNSLKNIQAQIGPKIISNKLSKTNSAACILYDPATYKTIPKPSPNAPNPVAINKSLREIESPSFKNTAANALKNTVNSPA